MVLFPEDYDGINRLLQEEGRYVKSNFTESWVVGPENTKFFTRFYPATGEAIASAIFVHGFQEHITRYDHLFHKLATEANVDITAFDQRGWGRTSLDTENRSADSRYGLTRRSKQLGDVDFFLNREFQRVGDSRPVFLWGHSMGGGVVLSFAAGENGVPSTSTISRLSGIICSAPLIKQTKPIAKPLRVVAGLLSKVFPSLPFPVDVENSHLTTDVRVNAVAKVDPLMKSYATLGCINDVLNACDWLYADAWKQWPSSLPLLMTFGGRDYICDHVAGKYFFDHVTTLPEEDKTWYETPDAYHEIHNEPRFWEANADAVVTFINAHLTASGSGAKL